MHSLEFFGGASIRVEGGFPGGEAAQTRRIALLALLATSRTGPVARERLVAYLWPETAAAQGRHLLSESLYQLRKTLGSGALVSEGDSVRLDPDLVVSDVSEFETAIEQGDREHAVSVYCGPFLDGFYVRDAPEFELWVESERRRLADAYATALEGLASESEAARDYLGALGRWKQLTAHDPYNSRYALRSMQAMVAAGDPANAIQQAEEHVRLLQRELGVEPPGELLAYVEQLTRKLSPDAAPGLERNTAVRAVGEPPREAADQRRRLLTRRTLGLAVLAAVVLCGAVSVLWLALPRQGERATSEGASVDPAHRIAVLPFTYHGAEELAYLGETMDELLSSTLDGVGDLRTAHPSAVRGIVAQEAEGDIDLSQGSLVAQRLGAGRYVMGGVVEVEGRLRIDASLFTLGGDRDDAVAATVEGDVNDFYALVDGLTRQLLLAAVGPVRDYDRLAARTTDSLSALKAYLEGIGELRAIRPRPAIARFRRAVEIDSTFALAWFGIVDASASPGMTEYDLAVEASRQAVRHGERLPPRARGLLAVWSAMLHGEGSEAERLGRALVTRYPDDVDAWYALASVVMNFGPLFGQPYMAEGFEMLGRILPYRPTDRHYQVVGIMKAAFEREWARFDSLCLVHAGGDESAVHSTWRAVRAFGVGDEAAQDQILAEFGRAGNAEALLASHHAALFLKDVRAGADLARVATLGVLSPEARALAGVSVGELELAVGRWRAAQAELAKVATVKPHWSLIYRAIWGSSRFVPASEAELRALRDSIAAWDAGMVRPGAANAGARAHDLLAPQLRLYALGRLSWLLGDQTAALRHAGDLEAIGNPPEALTYAVDRAQSVRAHVLFDAGRFNEALEALEAQPRRLRLQYLWDAPFYPHSEDRFLRGEILVALGQYEEALRWYETIGEVYVGDFQYVALAHLRRAEIYERLAEPEKAALHYMEFIRFWQDSDPELRPLVEQARQALERLTSEPAAR